jgi:hypothetical protein
MPAPTPERAAVDPPRSSASPARSPSPRSAPCSSPRADPIHTAPRAASRATPAPRARPRRRSAALRLALDLQADLDDLRVRRAGQQPRLIDKATPGCFHLRAVALEKERKDLHRSEAAQLQIDAAIDGARPPAPQLIDDVEAPAEDPRSAPDQRRDQKLVYAHRARGCPERDVLARGAPGPRPGDRDRFWSPMGSLAPDGTPLSDALPTRSFS